MERRGAATARALAAVIVAQRCAARPDDAGRLARVTAAVLEQSARAPDVLRLPLALLLHLFDVAPIVRRGRRFVGLEPVAQAAALSRWRGARVGAFRSFVRYWESLVILAWYAEDDDHGA
jgi:hypothetical protein